MYIKNDGSNEYDALQNQFTSFLSFAVSNDRIDYIRAKIKEFLVNNYIILHELFANYFELQHEKPRAVKNVACENTGGIFIYIAISQYSHWEPANKKSSPQEDLTEENLQGEGE